LAINLYRRHRAECEAGHSEQYRSGEFEERKKGWKRCACLIHASGTLAGKFSRKSTGVTDWEKAKELVSSWKTWDGEVPLPVPEPIPLPAPSAGVIIERAVNAFLASHRESSAFTTNGCTAI